MKVLILLSFMTAFIYGCHKNDQPAPGQVRYCIICQNKQSGTKDTTATLDQCDLWQKHNGFVNTDCTKRKQP